MFAKLIKRLRKKPLGQSLVETALFMPIFLVLIAGLVEIGQWLLIQNRVTTAAREGVRFASNGGNNSNIAEVTLNTVTETLDLDSSKWDIWVLRGTVQVDDSGQAIEFEGTSQLMTHVYGDQQTRIYAEINDPGSTFMGDLQNQLLNELLEGQVVDGSDAGSFSPRELERADELKFVGVYTVYEAQSILGFERFVPQAYEVREMALMRTYDSKDAANGCTAFPIMVRFDARALGVSETDTFPTATEFEYPTTAPESYEYPLWTTSTATNLEDARTGWLFKLDDTSDANSPLNWARWNVDLPATTATTSAALTWPGNSHIYNAGPGGPAGAVGLAPLNGFTADPVYGFIDTNNAAAPDPKYPNDTDLSTDDLVGTTNATLASVASVIQGHIDAGRQLRIVAVGDALTDQNGETVYPVVGFPIITPVGYNTNDNGRAWLLFEFERWDTSCGQGE